MKPRVFLILDTGPSVTLNYINRKLKVQADLRLGERRSVARLYTPFGVAEGKNDIDIHIKALNNSRTYRKRRTYAIS